MKKYKVFSFIIILGFLLIIWPSCIHQTEPDNQQPEGLDTLSHRNKQDHNTHGIFLTEDQINTMNITMGEFSRIKVNDFIKATGTLGLPPNAYASINAKTNGFIQGSGNYVEGDFIQQGEVIAYLENPDFIGYQKDYLESRARLEYLRIDLARQQKLVFENAGIVKNVQKLESDVKVMEATLEGLEKQLEFLGIKTDDLHPVNIVDQIPLYAPMDGYITSIYLHNGMYATPERELIELVSEDHLHLELDIFESDIEPVQEGLKISYTVPALGTKVYQGEVHVIGKEFNRENKTVRVHGHLEEERPRFFKDLFVEAKIWLDDETVTAIPEEGIIREGSSAYIFAGSKPSREGMIKFEKFLVIPGVTDQGYTAVKLVDSIPDSLSVVTQGAYFVHARSRESELEHSH